MTHLLHGMSSGRRRLLLLICVATVALVAGVAVVVATRQSAAPTAAPAPAASSKVRCSVSYLQSSLHLTHVTVDSASSNSTSSFTAPHRQPITGLPAFCDVTLTQTDSAGNPIHIRVWLPQPWNGRFQGVGGGEYSCGPNYSELAHAIQTDYAAAATDCGVNPADAGTGIWALGSNGQLDVPLIDDFAYAGIHDMTVDGKAVTQAYYPSPLHYSYFYGCSTGGREGLMEAQRYPADYNGIVSGAPAINWTSFVPAEIWPELVMNESHDFLPSCKEDAFVNSAVQACATTNGVITNPGTCDWSPDKLVGSATPCGVITQQDAAVMTKIWQGPETTQGKPLWSGLERGASVATLAATTTSNGVTTGKPFTVPVSWLGIWLQRNPTWNWHTLTYAQFDTLFQQSLSEFSNVLATNNPDLSAFKAHGGKIIIWHGLADQEIFPQGTINYYLRVQQAMGGPAATDSFARLFLASGAQHCNSAAGPAPKPPVLMNALTHWVEQGAAPASILAGSPVHGWPLCLYPGFARYTGSGNTKAASSYVCAT